VSKKIVQILGLLDNRRAWAIILQDSLVYQDAQIQRFQH